MFNLIYLKTSGDYDVFETHLDSILLTLSSVNGDDGKSRISEVELHFDRIHKGCFKCVLTIEFSLYLTPYNNRFRTTIESDYNSVNELSIKLHECNVRLNDYLSNGDNKPVSTTDLLNMLLVTFAKQFDSDVLLTSIDCVSSECNYNVFLTFDTDNCYDDYKHIYKQSIKDFFKSMCLYEKKSCKYNVIPFFDNEPRIESYPDKSCEDYYYNNMENQPIDVIETTIINHRDWIYLDFDTVKVNGLIYAVGTILQKV